jgi:predicted Zn-dependent protease
MKRFFFWLTGLMLLLFCCTSSPQNPNRLPALGDGEDFSIGEERRLGDTIASEILRDPDVIQDPVLEEYLDNIWRALISSARLRGELQPDMEERFAWKLMLIRDRSVNAFALPGGYMGVHLGLIAVSSSKDELASVLGHELSHVTQRHIARTFTKQSREAPLMIASMILGLLAASRSPDAASAMIIGGQAAAMQSQLSFSRDMEREADRVGFAVMKDAGFDPQGFVGLFEKLQQASRLNDNGNFPYLRTHPLTTERIADMQSRLQMLKLPFAAPPSIVHAFMTSRARLLTNLPIDELHKIQQEANSPTPSVFKKAAALYAGVMVNSKLKNLMPINHQLTQLEALASADSEAQVLLQWLKAEIAIEANAPNRALEILEGLHNERRPQLMLNTQARLAFLNPDQARLASEDLLKWLATHRTDTLAMEYLGQSLPMHGEQLRGLRMLADELALKFDYVAAIDRLLAAQDLSKKMIQAGKISKADEMESAIIDSKLRSLLSLRREQSLQR